MVAQLVKNPPAMETPPVQETQFQSLDWEDPLEEIMATHSSILAWRMSWLDLGKIFHPKAGVGAPNQCLQ